MILACNNLRFHQYNLIFFITNYRNFHPRAVMHQSPEIRAITTQLPHGRLSRPSRAAALEQTGIPARLCSRPLRKTERPAHSRDQLQGTVWPAKPAILQLEQLRTRLAEFQAARPLGKRASLEVRANSQVALRLLSRPPPFLVLSSIERTM